MKREVKVKVNEDALVLFLLVVMITVGLVLM